jgi:glycolate oxidase FAD binding subunit
MPLTASSLNEVRESLSAAARSGERITSFDLRRMARVLEYTPEDMTVSVEAGITLAELQRRLAERGQWLPVDPPKPDALTIGALLAANKCGPRRFGYGTVRDYLLGIKVVLADGRVIKAGGKVVKNVAGYDLCKLFVGSMGTLGVILEATFKVLPRPEKEDFAKLNLQRPAELGAWLDKINASPVTPVVIDLYGDAGASVIVLGFAGPREDVEWQMARAREIGFTEGGSLEYERNFWTPAEPVHRASVLPSRVGDTLRNIAPNSYVARAGNGVIYYRGGSAAPKRESPHDLMRRIKDTYDPKHLLPELPPW